MRDMPHDSKDTFYLLEDRVYQDKIIQKIEEAKEKKLHELDLSGFELNGLSSEIGTLHHLKELNISNTSLSSLPSEIGLLKNLTRLDLHQTKLNSLPPEIGNLTNLTWMNLSKTSLTSLPPEIGQLINLKKLDLHKTKLSCLPPEIGNLNNLYTLNLSYNNLLRKLPPEIVHLGNLKGLYLRGTNLNGQHNEILQMKSLITLDLSYLKPDSVPPDIVQLTNLKVLNLSWTKLRSIPPAIVKLNNLERLNLSQTSLSSLPPEIRELKNLKWLDLSNTPLTNLPPEIEQLKKLICLNLSSTKLNSLPPEMVQLKNLKELYLSDICLHSLPPGIEKLKNLKSLKLNGTYLDSLPPEIEQLKNLTTLDLSIQQLSNLPSEIAHIRNLKELYLRDTDFNTIPPEVLQLKSLTTLDLSFSKLISLPPEIEELNNLKVLYLNTTDLRNFPSEILQLEGLERLDLSKTDVRSLPSEITKWKNLSRLNLSDTKLSGLPPEIGQLKNLRELILQKNPLHSLPEEIGQLKNLTWLNIHHTRLFSLPPVLEELPNLTMWYNNLFLDSKDTVKKYFDKIKMKKSFHLYEARLIIIGQGNVGKTSLMNQLVHGSISDTVPTEGIAINTWNIKTAQKDDLKINIWDFGGNEVYHDTHKYFLANRSLYLFVWDAQHENENPGFNYWLDRIKTLSDSSPVIVVQNKIDKSEEKISQEEWKNRYPNIVGFYNASAKDTVGINELRQAIIGEIEKLPHMGGLLPKKLKDIRKDLKGLNKNSVSYKECITLFQEYGFNKIQSERSIEYYHDLGIFLHFKNNPFLRDTLFLKPQWVTNAVYYGPDKNKIREKFGMVLIPGGEFICIKKNKNEEKQILKPFALCMYPVTQYLYEKVTGTNPSHFKGYDLPVESISWLDAVTFCNELSEQMNLDKVYNATDNEISIDLDANGYRLPTEIEWEYACRAGTTGERYGELDEIAWYHKNSGDKTHPVGLKKPNNFGLYDMLGNAWEWCNDLYAKGSYRVLRGGSCGNEEEYCRASYRSGHDHRFNENCIGFRPARNYLPSDSNENDR